MHWLEPGEIWSGISVGLGILLVYALSTLGLTIARALAASGSLGFIYLGKYAYGRYAHARGENWQIVNLTINTVHEGRLKFDTVVADRALSEVWTNIYLVQAIRRAAKLTTVENPVLHFNLGVMPWLLSPMSRVRTTENGTRRRVSIVLDDDYSSIYNPLISLACEHITNSGSVEMALKQPVTEHRFVVALTFEQLTDRRVRHFRAMIVSEEELVTLSPFPPIFNRPEHNTRYRTLLAIKQQYIAHPHHFGIINLWRPQRAVRLV